MTTVFPAYVKLKHPMAPFLVTLSLSMALAPLSSNAQTSEVSRTLSASPGLPSLGDAGLMTSLEERKLGDTIIRELYRDPAYIDDPIIGEYVDSIWRALLAGARARGELPSELEERYAWEILLGRDRTINAFALPGGYFGLHLGLVGVVTTRDELASVLAHEMSHITQRHIPRMLSQQSRQTPLMMAAMVVGMIAASKNPQAGAALAVGGQAAIIQQQLNYSRDMEREADRIGYGVLEQSGFSPRGFTGMFDKLQNASRLSDNGDWPYLRSHPLTTERFADMQQRQRSEGLNPAASPPPDLEALLIAARARVLGRPGVDVLRAWAGEPEGAGFSAQPLPRRAAALYAAALAHVQLRDLPRAQTAASQLSSLVGSDGRASRQVRLLQAELALQSRQPERVLTLLPAGSQPSAKDGKGQAGRPELLLRAEALTQTGQGAEAASSLQPWVSDRPGDAGAWQALAGAYGAQGQALRALRAEGEAQFAHRELAGAVDRFRAAQDYSRKNPGNSADLIEASIIDTRLREVQAALALQRQEEAKLR